MSTEDRSSPDPPAGAVDGVTPRYRREREEIIADPSASASQRRDRLTSATDAWLGSLFTASGADVIGGALIAVGGYGRRELSPGSDIDVMLLVPDSSLRSTEVVSDRLWYPAWDSGVRIDHSVRTAAEARRLAGQDLRVALGLLDARCVAGDEESVSRLRSSVLSDWRALAVKRLGELHRWVRDRRARFGDLAHVLEPDLKEAYGGLRDAVVVRAVAASWITDVPRQGFAEALEHINLVRDSLHEHHLRAKHRPHDRLTLQDQVGVSDRLGLDDPDELLRGLSSAARVVAYASDVMWHRIDRITHRPPRTALRRRLRHIGPERVPLAEGVVVHDGEVTLAESARPERDPVLVLRAAAAAAQAGLPMSPAAVQALAVRSAPMGDPWPASARESLISLLGAGGHLVSVWEALDAAGIPQQILPEWSVVRSAPQRNPLHTFTVDRHLIETAAHAGSFVRSVSRPDLLLVGAWLHDIGKARPGDHTEVGVQLVGDIAPRLGFDEEDARVLVDLVRHHLLLPEMATRRDIEDPATIRQVADAVGSAETLDLLHALTQADAAATGPAAWSEWKKGLIDALVRRVHGELQHSDPDRSRHAHQGVEAAIFSEEDRMQLDASGTSVRMERVDAGSERVITVATDDRLGLLAVIAGVFAMHRLHVRSADTLTRGRRVVSRWMVTPMFGDPPLQVRLREDVIRALAGDLDVGGHLALRATPQAAGAVEPWVEFIPGASVRFDVLEVRAHDEPGLLHRIGTALAAAGADVASARVATLGSEVVDVFYLRRPDGAALGEDHRAAVRTTVLAALAVAGRG